MSAIPATIVGERRGARDALLLAALCVVGLALTWVLAELVPITHEKDAVALYDFTRLNRPVVEAPATALLDLLYTPFYIAWGIALAAIALRRGLPRVALAVAVMLPVAPLSAELLKPLLAHPHDQIGPSYITNASWPSGHSTAITALVWCALLVAPAARRRAVAIAGLALIAAVSCSLLILAWHMPSDVLGGYLLATMWAALALAVLLAVGPRGSLRAAFRRRARPARPRARREPIAPPPLSHSRRG
jgi:membrane-associated phospholipid phosphatase